MTVPEDAHVRLCRHCGKAFTAWGDDIVDPSVETGLHVTCAECQGNADTDSWLTMALDHGALTYGEQDPPSSDPWIEGNIAEGIVATDVDDGDG